MKKAVKIFAEFLLAFFAVTAATLAVFVWQVSSHPIKSTTLTPYVEAVIEGLMPGSDAAIEETEIAWDNEDRTIALRGSNVRLKDKSGETIVEFPLVKIKLSALGLLYGRLVPSEMFIMRPQLRFVRKADGNMTFGASNSAAGENTGKKERISLIDFFRNFSDEITENSLLKSIVVEKMALVVHDEETGQDKIIDVPEIALHNGAKKIFGRASIEAMQKDQPILVAAVYEYEKTFLEHGFTLKFTDINPSLLASAHPMLSALSAADEAISGELSAKADRELNVKSVSASLTGGEGKIISTELWDEPLPVKSFSASAAYDRTTKKLSISSAELNVGETKISVSAEADLGNAVRGDAENKDIFFSIKIGLSELPMDKFSSVWPKPAIPDARDWIVRSMSAGNFKNGEVSLRGRTPADDLMNITLESGEGKITAANAKVSYMEGMPPVEGADAEASFNLDGMEVQVSGGSVGSLKIKPTTLLLTDFQKNLQYIQMPVKFSGSVKEVVKLLDAPQFGYAKEIGLSANECDGTVDGVLELRFPLLEDLYMKDVELKANGSFKNFSASKLIPSIPVTAGNLVMDLDKSGFTVKGQAELRKLPFLANVKALFRPGDNEAKYSAEVVGKIPTEGWPSIAPSVAGKIVGDTSAKISYANIRGKPPAVSADLDLTHAALNFGEIGLRKDAGTKASLKFDADMLEDGGANVRNIDAAGDGIKISGSASLDKDMNFVSADLSKFAFGRNDAKVSYSKAIGKNTVEKIVVTGESLDISNMESDKTAQADKPAKEYDIKLNKLHTSENGYIENLRFKAARDAEGWSEIELTGLANNEHPVDIKLGLAGAKRVLSIKGNDFGKTLMALGITETVKSGEFEINGESAADNARVINGKIKIGSFYVDGLPALVRLLSAASPFGFADLISGESSFDSLKGKFTWRGDVLEFSKVRATGSVFGINVEGSLNFASDTADLRGTLVPFSLFNSIINAMPLLGGVITGGDGQGIIAAAYTVKGPMSDPEISVNPASLLTPGFLRNLFFED